MIVDISYNVEILKTPFPFTYFTKTVSLAIFMQLVIQINLDLGVNTLGTSWMKEY